MLLFGHTGITLGTAVLAAGLFTKYLSPEAKASETVDSSAQSPQAASAPDNATPHKTSWFTLLGRYIDIRLLMVGSLLPDIIDKPAGQYIFREALSNGRIYSHTLLFLFLVTLSGWFIYQRRHQIWLLTLAFGTFTHLILDRMWESPQTLLWPLYGSAFPTIEFTGWLSNIVLAFFSGPEVISAAVIAWFMWVLLRRKAVYMFIRHGRV